MQTETLEKTTAKIAPYNEVAELIDREVHAKTLEQINVLAREYEIRNPSEVAAFLSKNKSLIDWLEEIPAQIRKVFGDEQNLKLEYYFDPEDSAWNKLHVYIPTKFKSRESRDLLEKFGEDWWFEKELQADSKIFVNLRFIK
jgi:bifunctional DNA-binding transcriptional regulator/antitoxin component of YhaV-PrlF toxin-antitoxin module